MSRQFVLYSSEDCPWSQRARIALKLSGAKFDIAEIDLTNKPEWYGNINVAKKVPTLAYGNFDGPEVSKPPAGTFILPESALIVNFIASLYPDIDYKDPVTRAKANLLAFQFENVTLPPFLRLVESSTGDDKSIQAFLSGVKALDPYLDDEVVNTTEYGLGDILIAPLLEQHTKNCIFLFCRHEAGSFEEGTGQKTLDLLQSEPEYSKFLKYWEKLKTWDARKSTADDDVLLAGWKAKGAKKHG